MKINDVVYDSQTKEYVKISNGIERDGQLVPTEAIAVRVTNINDQGKPLLAFTYRKISPEFLRQVIPLSSREFELILAKCDIRI